MGETINWGWPVVEKLRPAQGDVFTLWIPESAAEHEQDFVRLRESIEPQLNGAKLIVLPAGASLRRATPYYVREKLSDHEREVGFATLAEMQAYLAGRESREKTTPADAKPGTPQVGGLFFRWQPAPPAEGVTVAPSAGWRGATVRVENKGDVPVKVNVAFDTRNPYGGGAPLAACPVIPAEVLGRGSEFGGTSAFWEAEPPAQPAAACPSNHHADGEKCRADYCKCRCGYCEGNRG